MLPFAHNGEIQQVLVHTRLTMALIPTCNAPISIKAIKHANNTFIQEIEATPHSQFKNQ